LTHILGRAAYAAGMEGLIVPTLKPNDAEEDRWHNLAIFPVKLLAAFIQEV